MHKVKYLSTSPPKCGAVVQFKALPCISCTKKCKLMNPTGASVSYGENDTALLPSHPSLLLYLLQVLQCKVSFLTCLNSCRSSPLCSLTFPVPEDKKVSWVGGNICSFFLFFPSLSHRNVSHKALKATLCSLDHLLPTH